MWNSCASIPSRWLLSFKLDARRGVRAQTPWRRDAASLSPPLTLTSLRRPRPSSTDRQHDDVTRTSKDDAISGVMHCHPRRRLRHHLRRRRWRPVVVPSISVHRRVLLAPSHEIPRRVFRVTALSRDDHATRFASTRIAGSRVASSSLASIPPER